MQQRVSWIRYFFFAGYGHQAVTCSADCSALNVSKVHINIILAHCQRKYPRGHLYVFILVREIPGNKMAAIIIVIIAQSSGAV